jgi:hypothetical protein
VDQRAALEVVLAEASACFTTFSGLMLLNASRVLVIATLSAMARVAVLCGCVPMIITLRNEVASAIPAHAADALVDLMSVLARSSREVDAGAARTVRSRRQYSWADGASDAAPDALLRCCY